MSSAMKLREPKALLSDLAREREIRYSFGARFSVFKSQLNHLLAGCPWARYSPSLCLLCGLPLG